VLLVHRRGAVVTKNRSSHPRATVIHGPRPHAYAISADGDPLTYDEAFQRALAGAAWLSGQPGDKLVFLGVNGPAFPVALFAAGLAGRPFVPLNYRLADADVVKQAARTAPCVCIVDADMAPRVSEVAGVTVVTREAFEAATRDPAYRATTPQPVDQPIKLRRRCEGEAMSRQSSAHALSIRSIIMAGAIPPAAHIVIKAYRPLERSSSSSAVPMRIGPVAPIG